MLRRFGHLAVIAALLAAIGGHWAILQSIAWATMLADNLKAGSVTEAVAKTFDGEHPCSMCKQITEGKKSEKKSDTFDLKVKKLELASVQNAFTFRAPTDFRLHPLLCAVAGSRTSPPPVPPPRRLAA